MMEASQVFNSITERFNLAQEDYNLQISDRHIGDISRLYCRKWKSLPPHLELRSIVMEDIDCGAGSEEDKRHSFLLKWKQMKGSEATYRILIMALLEIGCRQDAENVCKLLKKRRSLQSSASLPDREASNGTLMLLRTNIISRDFSCRIPFPCSAEFSIFFTDQSDCSDHTIYSILKLTSS